MFLRHVHSSSRYDRSAKSLRKAAKRYARHSEIITWTEVEHEHREAAIRNALPDWHHILGDQSYANDCGISYDPDRLTLLFADHDRATDVQYANVKGILRDPAYATYGVFRDKRNGKVLVVAVVHLASSIEGDIARKRTTKRTISFFTGFAGTKRRANRLAKAWDADGVAIIADFNLNFKLRWVRALIKTLAPSYRQTWKNFPRGGTHGSRVIDATLLRGQIRGDDGALLMKDDDSSDHRPYRERWLWRK